MRRSLITGQLELTDDDKRNGWDDASLFAYVEGRDKAFGLVPGNVVTRTERGRPQLRVENCRTYDPHRVWR